MVSYRAYRKGIFDLTFNQTTINSLQQTGSFFFKHWRVFYVCKVIQKYLRRIFEAREHLEKLLLVIKPTTHTTRINKV